MRCVCVSVCRCIWSRKSKPLMIYHLLKEAFCLHPSWLGSKGSTTPLLDMLIACSTLENSSGSKTLVISSTLERDSLDVYAPVSGMLWSCTVLGAHNALLIQYSVYMWDKSSLNIKWCNLSPFPSVVFLVEWLCSTPFMTFKMGVKPWQSYHSITMYR